jgi:hypothetical protein
MTVPQDCRSRAILLDTSKVKALPPFAERRKGWGTRKTFIRGFGACGILAGWSDPLRKAIEAGPSPRSG